VKKTILFIDGENFRHKIEEAIGNKSGKERFDLSLIDFNYLFNQVLKDYKISRKIYYSAKLHSHEDTKEQSEKLIKLQRKLRNKLLSQGFEFLIAGHVRGQTVRVDHKAKIIFKEKGVDVKIAVDMVSFSADKIMDTSILCSSDSDLQPAIKEVRKRGTEVIYLGFEIGPNKGLSFTTNKTVLFRNSEIIEAFKTKN
jgi:uncharacterized LabA/DUF88 family protein